MLKNITEVRKNHPLCKKEVKTITSWEEWKRIWDKTEEAEMLIGLLHTGFDIDCDGDDFWDKRIFYLEIAYGYRSSCLFDPITRPTDSGFVAGHAKKGISQKAWAMLCQKYFKACVIDSDLYCNPDLIKKLLWFFTESKNLPFLKEHNTFIVNDFLVAFVSYCLFHDPEELNPFISETVFNNRSKFIEILWHMKRLDLLIEKHEYLIKSDIDFLKGLALSKWRSAPNEKAYKTLDDALLGVPVDSRTAQNYLVLSKIFKARKRRQKRR